jgi:hypothetical protein
MDEELKKPLPRLGLSPDETAIACAVSRTRVFEAIRKGELKALKAGKSTVIEVEEAQRWLRSMPFRKVGGES